MWVWAMDERPEGAEHGVSGGSPVLVRRRIDPWAEVWAEEDDYIFMAVNAAGAPEGSLAPWKEEADE
jgi:hypothetical protein